MLRVENLRVCYGDFVAVDAASIQIKEGEIAALIGMNGAGKTSLLSAVAGLLRPAAGRVLFDGEDITGLPADRVVSRGLSLVPQGGRCFSRMSVRDNLLVGSYPKAARRNAAASLERVYSLFPVLYEKRKTPAGALSGGQRQMLAIGRALMAGPKCLLFDEISLGLAPVAIRDLYVCIERLNREEKLTILLLEQDTARALACSDRFFVILGGRIVMSGDSSSMDKETIKSAYFGI